MMGVKDVKLKAGNALQITYGWLKPVLVTTPEDKIDVFIYPKTTADPLAASVQESFRATEDGFSTVLGCVSGSQYVGRFAAGGYGDELDLAGDGSRLIRFDKRGHGLSSCPPAPYSIEDLSRDAEGLLEVYRNAHPRA